MTMLGLLLAFALSRPAAAARDLLSLIPSEASLEHAAGESLPPFAWNADLRTVAFAAKADARQYLVIGRAKLEVDEVRYLGYASDGRTLVSVCREDGRDVLRWDWKVQARYERILPPRFAGGRSAFAARSEGRWFVVADGRPGPGSDAVGSPVFSPAGNQLAYWRREGSQATLWLDGGTGFRMPLEGEGLAGVEDPVFSPDGRRWAFGWRQDEGRAVVVVDAQAGATFSDVGRPVFSPDSSRVMYSASRSAGVEHDLIVIDGRVLDGLAPEAPSAQGPAYERFERVWPYRFAPDGRPVFVAALAAGKEVLVADGRPSARYDAVTMPVFGPGGRRAFLARDGAQFKVVRAEGESGPYAAVSALRFDDRGRLVFVASREGKSFVAVDGEEDAPHDEIGELEVSSGTVAYWARDGEAWKVYSGGRAVSPPARQAGLLIWAAGTPVTTFRAEDGWRLGVGDEAHGPFDEIGPTLYDPDRGTVTAGVRQGRRLLRLRFKL